MKAGRASLLLGTTILGLAASAAAAADHGVEPRQRESLDRGVVAGPAVDGGVLVSWRLLAEDPSDLGFDVFRDGVRINTAPITDRTNLVDREGGPSSTYAVAVAAGRPPAPRSAHGAQATWPFRCNARSRG